MAANDTIVLNIEQLDIRITGRRFHAFPATGAIASIVRGAPRGVVTPGLYGTAAFSIIRSNIRTLTLNLFPNSTDDEFLNAAADAVEASPIGSILSATVSYQGSKWVSDACIVTTDPARNFTADGTEFLAWEIMGNFPIAKPIRFVNPGTLTADEITATI